MKFAPSVSPLLLTALAVTTTTVSSRDIRGGSNMMDGLREKMEERKNMFDGLREKMEESANELRSGKVNPSVGGMAMSSVHGMVAKAQEMRQHVHESVVKLHDELVAKRHDLAARLFTYEEGSLHFSMKCAKLSLGESAPTACSAESECNWCRSEGMASLHIDGFCAASADKDALQGWGVTCADETPQETWDFEEVEEGTLETEEEANLNLLVENTAAGNLADMFLVSESAFEQPENENEIEAILAQEAKDREDENLSGETSNAGDLIDADEYVHCLERVSTDDCDKGEDLEGRPCVWCKYNSWLGSCVTMDDQDVISGEFAMTCAEDEMK